MTSKESGQVYLLERRSSGVTQDDRDLLSVEVGLSLWVR